MHPIIIIGTGLGGYTLAREFRKLDTTTPLTIVTADDGRFYSKPLLSNAFKQGKDAVTLATATAAQMAEQLQADILTSTRVTALDPAEQTIRTDTTTLNYSQLILALGADPIRLPLAGDGAAEVLSVNDLIDYGVFRAAVADKERVVIIGAGLIGCEFANDLRGAGHTVAVIDPAPWPLVRLLPEPAGRALQQGLAAQGVDFRLGIAVTAVDRSDTGFVVTLDDGTSLDADVVLSAVGLQPRRDLAQAAGMTVKRGIQVDRSLQTSAAGVYALGDCAEVGGLVLPYVMPIMHAARALAKTLTGTPTPVRYPAMPVVVKTPAHPTVVAPPAAEAQGEWLCEPVGQGVKALFQDADGNLLGFALTGEAVAEKQALTKTLPATLG